MDFRSRYHYSATDFLVVYSGNIGVKQGLESVLEAIARTTHPELRFVICGDGVMRDALQSRAHSLCLRRVHFFDLLPQHDYQQLLDTSDICLVPQAKGSGASFLPSKLLAILATPKPVIAVADAGSEVAIAMAEGQFGIAVEPDKPEELANIFDHLPDRREDLATWAANGRTFVEPFDIDAVHERFECVLSELAGSSPQRKRHCARNQNSSEPHGRLLSIRTVAVVGAVIVGMALVYYSFKPQPSFRNDAFLPEWAEQLADDLPQFRTFIAYIGAAILIPFLPKHQRSQLSLRFHGFAFGGLVLFLVTSEMIQWVMPYRHFDWMDVFWGTTGMFCGIVLGIGGWLILSGRK